MAHKKLLGNKGHVVVKKGSQYRVIDPQMNLVNL